MSASGGQSSRKGFQDYREERPQRNQTYSGGDVREYNSQYRDGNPDRETYSGVKDQYGKRDSYGNRENYGKRERESYANRDVYESGNRNEPRGYEEGSRIVERRKEDGRRGRGGSRGGYKESRGGGREQPRDSQVKHSGGRGKNAADYERQFSGGGRDDRAIIERQNSSGRDPEQQYKRQNEGERETGVQDYSGTRYRNDLVDRVPARTYEKPSPKSYYTLSATDDEKLMDEDYVQNVTASIQDMNVTVTGDKRSFKDREKPKAPGTPRSQTVSQQFEERREGKSDFRNSVALTSWKGFGCWNFLFHI